MNILISGASGLIGQEIANTLSTQGHKVLALQRKDPASPPYWDIADKTINLGDDTNVDAVIHLAGDNIASGRWNKEKKAKIRESRVAGTTLLAKYFARLENRPKVFITASAVGFYGHRPAVTLTEKSEKGRGFLAAVCKEWEEATAAAEQAGIRVVNLRLGMVLSRNGGALQKMLPPFKLGFGGIIGNGKQVISWIAIDDIAGAIKHILENEQLSGPVNIVAPNPVTNKTLTKALGSLLNRPTVLPLPAVLANLLLGEMAKELLLSSTKVLPEKLQDSGYKFRYPTLEEALISYLRH